jgi:chromosome segregation ATPase
LQKYSLLALYEARKSAVKDAERVIAQRTVDCKRADSHFEAAQARLADFRARLEAEAQSQLRRALEGQSKVADLQVGASFRHAAQNELATLTLALQRAKSTSEECKAMLGQSRYQVELLRQELAVVERHRERFLEHARRTEEAEADEDAAELWQTRQSAYPREGSK